MLVAVPARIGGGIGSRKSADRSTTLVFGALASRSLITFCVVACGSAQKARSRPDFFQSMPSIEDERRQIVRRELRKHVAHLLPGAAVGGEQRDLDARMAQQQPHQFRAGIAGGAEHADLGFLGHDVILPLFACGRIRGRISGERIVRETCRGTGGTNNQACALRAADSAAAKLWHGDRHGRAI